MDAPRSVLCILSQADPAAQQEAIELALVAAAFDARVSVLFRSAAVFDGSQQGTKKGASAPQSPIVTLKEFGVEKLFVSKGNPGEQIDSFAELVTVIDQDAQRQLIASADIVIND